MPSRAPHPCASPSCPILVTQGSYCTEHERTRRQRDPAQAAFYSSGRWTKLSKWVRARDPICRICTRKPSRSADHINGQWDDNRPENLQGICKTCHDEKSGREHRQKVGL